MKELISSMPKRNLLLLLASAGVPFNPDMSMQELMGLQMDLVENFPAQTTISEEVKGNNPTNYDK
jgi:hypothetical protein